MPWFLDEEDRDVGVGGMEVEEASEVASRASGSAQVSVSDLYSANFKLCYYRICDLCALQYIEHRRPLVSLSSRSPAPCTEFS